MDIWFRVCFLSLRGALETHPREKEMSRIVQTASRPCAKQNVRAKNTGVFGQCYIHFYGDRHDVLVIFKGVCYNLAKLKFWEFRTNEETQMQANDIPDEME